MGHSVKEGGLFFPPERLSVMDAENPKSHSHHSYSETHWALSHKNVHHASFNNLKHTLNISSASVAFQASVPRNDISEGTPSIFRVR